MYYNKQKKNVPLDIAKFKFEFGLLDGGFVLVHSFVSAPLGAFSPRLSKLILYCLVVYFFADDDNSAAVERRHFYIHT